LTLTAGATRAEDTTGSLLLIGGGLRSENEAIYCRFVALAGGPERAVIGVVTAASLDPTSRVADDLLRYGVPRGRIVPIAITEANAAVMASDPAVVAQIMQCTGLFFGGGDQRRAARAFLGAEGRGTPALTAVRTVYERGGVIAGSSAGAAVQGERMISASGTPIETLDYGLAARSHDRGALLSRGLGLFPAGLVDQHFNTYKCRLARLARALIETKIPRGFGLDENTAMHVRADGLVEVVGAGGVTVVDAVGATLDDGPLGVRISAIQLCYLESGDAFDLRTCSCRIHPGKSPIDRGKEAYLRNSLVTDLERGDSLKHALTRGLVDNAAGVQVGLLLRFNRHHGHGYALTFSKTEETRGYRDDAAGSPTYAAHCVRLDVAPVSLNWEPSTSSPLLDLDNVTARQEIQAVVFRGLLLPDREQRFHPGHPLLRAEFAGALAQLIDTEDSDPAAPGPVIVDITGTTVFADEIRIVVAAGLMEVSERRFRPESFVTRLEVETALTLIRRRSEPLGVIDLSRPVTVEEGGIPGAGEFRSIRPHSAGPHDPVTREEVAVALYRFLNSPGVRP
jgi:cyanophycinase